MQTLILCYEQTWGYELYDQEALTRHQVKDYDGMDFAASSWEFPQNNYDQPVTGIP